MLGLYKSLMIPINAEVRKHAIRDGKRMLTVDKREAVSLAETFRMCCPFLLRKHFRNLKTKSERFEES